MLRLPARVLYETVHRLVSCGSGNCECMIFWTGPVGDVQSVVEWVHPAHHRSPYGCEIDGEWLNRYWFQLADSHQSLRAQIHTHPGLAFHSSTDDQWPVVSQPGFISIVVPYFGAGPIDMNAYWVGVLQDNGKWMKADPASVLEITHEKET